jgi:thymidylate synthase ThyX
LRRLFLKEYVGPIIHPEEQKNWIELTEKERKEAIHTRDLFLFVIERLNKGESVESVVNVQRGRKFFDTWLAQYGDDSIAELGGIHLCIEGASNIAVKEMQDKRIGISPLEKSTRYVQFWEKRHDGNYQYIIPGELKGTKIEDEYKKAMDLLFDTYSKLAEPYFNYIKQLYPKGDDETDRSF